MKKDYINNSNSWVVVSDLFNSQNIEFTGNESEANKFYNQNIKGGEPVNFNDLFIFAPKTGLNFENEWKKITL